MFPGIYILFITDYKVFNLIFHCLSNVLYVQKMAPSNESIQSSLGVGVGN